MTAVICGTPMPATTRVVQMEPGPMPTLTTSAPAHDQVVRGVGGGDVAGDDRQVADMAFLMRLHGGAARRRSGRGRCPAPISVHLGVHQRGHALHHIAGDAHGGGAEQAALASLAELGYLLGLLNVLDGDQAAQHVVFVHQRQLFDAVLGQNLAWPGPAWCPRAR